MRFSRSTGQTAKEVAWSGHSMVISPAPRVKRVEAAGLLPRTPDATPRRPQEAAGSSSTAISIASR